MTHGAPARTAGPAALARYAARVWAALLRREPRDPRVARDLFDEGDRARATDWQWKAFLAVGVAMAIGYLLLPNQGIQNIAYQIPGSLAAVAVLAGILLHKPADRRPWLLLAGGLVLTTAGDWTWVVLDLNGQDPFPSVADVFYLGGLALIVASLLLLVRGRVPGGDRATVLDALIVAVGVGLLSWVFLIEPIVADTTRSLGEIGVALAYPVLDVLLLGILASLFLTPGKRVTALYLIIGALVSFLLSDFIYAFLAISDGYQTGQLVDGGWLIGSAFWGAAALHPSMQRVAEPIRPGEVRLPAWRLVMLAGASLMAPAVLVIEGISGAHIDIPVIATGCVVLFLLVIARLAGLVSELRATLAQRRVLEAALERRILTDPLTSLANRVLFHDRLEHVLAKRDGQAAVLFIDLDDFKTVNDAYGHEAGDTVLRSVADAIHRTVRPGDTTARLGGDEFGVLLEDGTNAYLAGQVADRLIAAISEPTAVASREYSIGASIGISIGSGSTSDAETLMREADIAMYVAKGQGKGRFSVFEPSTHGPVLRSLELRIDLERAIADHEFEVHYQPIIELGPGTLAGIEALVRWRHPRRGLLAPMEFIPLAEATGTIVPLGEWILGVACREGAKWSGLGSSDFSTASGASRASGVLGASITSGATTAISSITSPPSITDDFFVSVNLSPIQIVQPDFPAVVARALAASGLAPSQLVLEMTESVRLDHDAASVALHELRKTGVRLAIDDFGTGYASLSQLRRIPFDILKIDKSFIAALTPGSRAESLIAGIVEMAGHLGIAVVAEGIETPQQLAELRAMGCAFGQGFDFAEPMPSEELAALLGVPPKGLRPARAPETRRSRRVLLPGSMA
jgi:diguanylate cyclase (GGDEF)-like protein